MLLAITSHACSSSGVDVGTEATGGQTAGALTSIGGSDAAPGSGQSAGRGHSTAGSSSAGSGTGAVGNATGATSSTSGGGTGGGDSTLGGSSGSGGVVVGAGGELTAGGSPASGVGGAPGSGGTADSGGAPAAGGATGGAGSESTDPSSRCPDATWNLVWGDDFDGTAGSAVDGGKWAYDSGPNWYNGELQTYTTGTTNASLDGDGNLIIESRAEAREGRQYTSARLKTEGKYTFTYGRIEGRMKLPYGQGMWPAFWMLGGNSWPGDGEIDIMENLGREPSIAHGTIHGPGYSGAAGPGASFTLPDGEAFSDDYHVFAVEWEPDVIRWYVDGEHYSTKTPADVGGNRWVFDHAFFIILNVAVGGEWPGNPDDTTVFPQRMLVDYIRVCQK